MRIDLSGPDITEAEINAVVNVLRTPNLSLGPKLPEFEAAFTKYMGLKRAVAVNSGTSGLHLLMLAAGIGPGDEVITTPFTFIATSNCIMMVGAKPVMVDIDRATLNIDPSKIEAAITPRTKAVIPVDAFGSPADMDKVQAIAAKHKLFNLEDSCEALGSTLNGRLAGTFGDACVFAFYPNKQMTTGEGGMILTNDDRLADMCVSLRNQGRSPRGGWLAHERLGYNFRLSDINCALGIVQLSRMAEIKAKRRQVAAWYQEMLAGETRMIVPSEPEGCNINWFVFVIQLAGERGRKIRNGVMENLRSRGIGVNNYFVPVHLQPFMVEKYGYKQGDFPVTEAVAECTIALPFYNNLTKDQVATVCSELRDCLDKT
ncbi:MAG TPA: DegT/DnrJ/EryC1/StrS family aminotransferase [Sedimentisphaerales bacterium]|nr:DegT/DnrJ/EryC1/StrS family aminotransferase [Sedimentisphaerales bacterium]